MSLSGVIIAGGKSSRMGRDKALLPFGNYTTLAEFQYRKLEKIFEKVYISTKSNKFPFIANLIYDKYKNSSPLNAIISTLESIGGDIFLLSVDIPFVSIDIIKKLIHTYKKNPNYDIYIAKSPCGLEPTVAIYKQTILNRAKEMYNKGDFKLMNLIKSVKYLEVNFENLEDFINLNTKVEYIRAKSMAKR